jgi:NhaA family Na+:H+ antiporter
LHLVEKIKSLTKAAGTPLQQLEHALHPVVLFVVMPVFALANAGISFEGVSLQGAVTSASMGVFFGLLAGKFIGVVGTSWLFVKMGWARLPGDMTFKNICGLGLLAGIGFTMSLFVTNLALQSPEVALEAKIGILTASLLAGIGGFIVLNKTLPKNGG